MEPLTAEGAEKSRRGRREEHGLSFLVRSQRFFLRSLWLKAFLTVQISLGEVSDGMQS
jgi:hypothetical protein